MTGLASERFNPSKVPMGSLHSNQTRQQTVDQMTTENQNQRESGKNDLNMTVSVLKVCYLELVYKVRQTTATSS